MFVGSPSYQVAPISLNQKLDGIPTQRVRNPPTFEPIPHQLQYPSILSSKFCTRLRCYSTTITAPEKEESFTVSYLINNFGFSPQKARKAAKKVRFEDAQRPDVVVIFLINYGFSNFQVREIIQDNPSLLLSEHEKVILPKLEFLLSQGFSKSVLCEMVTASPIILRRSLENHIIPLVHLIKSLHPDTKKALEAIRCCMWILISVTRAESNISFLRQSGMPDSKIAILLQHYSSSIVLNLTPNEFPSAVAEVKEMGFDISKSTFAVALGALKTMNKSKWQSKFGIYKKWGWSEQDFREAFRRRPWCMYVSEQKIEEVMNFFVNQMGCHPEMLAKHPILFSMSLKKRIIPRACVLKFLLSSGLISGNSFTAFEISEKRFLLKFVENFAVDAPRLLEIYQEEIFVSS